jgi:DNA primase catalytic core
MPLAPRAEIERIKREVSIQRLAEARGIRLRRSGKELIGLCPFHKDTSPSLNIDPKKNEWHCKGACGEGGDVIKWVMRAQGISFSHALEILRRDLLPMTSASPGPPPKKSTVPKLPPLVEHSADDKQLLEIVVAHYHETLKQSPEAQQYLVKRGLQSAEMVKHFRLGFANRTLGYHLPASNRVTGEEQRGRLKELGILRDSGHEHFRGSVVIPILNLNGEVVQMYGRKITAAHQLREGTPDHLYLPGPHRGVWNEVALTVSKEIILCEALIDALTFWCAGFRHVTTSYGVNGFTEEIKAAFRKHGTKRIYIAYDRDEAGEKTAHKHAAELLDMGIDCFRVQFPKSMDANEFALKVQPAAKSLGVMLNRAEWLGKGKRPRVQVIEPVKSTAVPAVPKREEEAEPAAKEKNISVEPGPDVATEIPILPAQPELRAERIVLEANQPAFSLAAPVEVVRQEEVGSPPMPSALSPVIEVPTEIKPNGIVIITQQQRRYEIRGLQRNTSYEALKVTITVSGTNARGDLAEHADTVNFYSAQQRTIFAKQASDELAIKEDIIRSELGRVRLKLEELRDQQLDAALKKPEAEIQMSAEEQNAAMELLRDPRLLDRIVRDFERCGMVGEETNKLVGYLAAVSRMLETPLAILVQSTSAAGKSALMESVLAFVPDEQRVQYSAMTGQALFYMGETDLKNRVLAIVEEEGAQRAAYALKLLQSEGVLSIASTGKDPNSGKLVTHQYRVEGPVMIFLTTTAIDLDEELMNRCVVLTVNEDREQTKAIHDKQREDQTLEGLLRRQERIEILRVHRTAQRLLKPLLVVNPYARELTFPSSTTRTRRDHTKYLALIRAVALLHQYQRQVKTVQHDGQAVRYIEVTWTDIEIATKLAREVLGRSLDELQPQTRNLLLLLDQMVRRACDEQKIERSEFRFSRRDVREFTKWSDSQLKCHLHRLEELEYLIVHRGGRGQSMVYELFFECQGDWRQLFLPGLIDPEKLKTYDYDANKSGVKGEKSGANEEKSGPSLGQVWGVSGGGLGEESPVSIGLKPDFYANLEKNTYRAGEGGANRAIAVTARPNGQASAAAVRVK